MLKKSLFLLWIVHVVIVVAVLGSIYWLMVSGNLSEENATYLAFGIFGGLLLFKK